MAETVSMDTLVSLCKQRGFVFQSSEIYGGLSSAWDYGPLGVELKNRIQRFWWREMTQLHDNIVGLDAAIMMHPRVWEASGHVENFTDPLVDCKGCKQRFREDQIRRKTRRAGSARNAAGRSPTRANSTSCSRPTSAGRERRFDSLPAPETAQGIYVNYRNCMQTSRLKIPFGIAQVGKAFRNEIVTKNFIFRTCEFEQMEMQFFVKPGEDLKWFEIWREKRMDYYRRLGIRTEKLRWHQHGKDELAHYAKDAYDIQYEFPMGWRELEGVHNRTDYDLKRHTEFSGKDLSYLEEETRSATSRTSSKPRPASPQRFDGAFGRLRGREAARRRNPLGAALPPAGRPDHGRRVPAGEKGRLARHSHKIEEELREHYTTFYDQSGSIGRRYRRQDEIGTPWCVTVDYDTKENNTVTLRHRDSMQQQRLPIAGLEAAIRAGIKEYKRPGA